MAPELRHLLRQNIPENFSLLMKEEDKTKLHHYNDYDRQYMEDGGLGAIDDLVDTSLVSGHIMSQQEDIPENHDVIIASEISECQDTIPILQRKEFMSYKYIIF